MVFQSSENKKFSPHQDVALDRMPLSNANSCKGDHSQSMLQFNQLVNWITKTPVLCKLRVFRLRQKTLRQKTLRLRGKNSGSGRKYVKIEI